MQVADMAGLALVVQSTASVVMIDLSAVPAHEVAGCVAVIFATGFVGVVAEEAIQCYKQNQ
jgi:hypothetical protein